MNLRRIVLAEGNGYAQEKADSTEVGDFDQPAPSPLAPMNVLRKRKSRRRSLLLLLGFLALCSLGYLSFVKYRATSPSNRSLLFDVQKPFRLDFGRGSGMLGLDTVSVAEGGRATLYRRVSEREWEHASMHLSQAQVGAIAKAVHRHGLPHLEKAYHPLTTIHDGTQWIVWIRQGDAEKSVYFDNCFPPPIQKFAKEFDAILRPPGHDRLEWKPVNPPNSRDHESDLWASLR